MKYLLALLAVAGLWISVLALRIHNQKPGEAPPCAVTERFDCGAVNHSRFAVFPPRTFDEAANSGGHIPVATLGIVAYAVLAIVALSGRFWILLVLSEIGLLMAGFLSYLEAYVLEKWCIYCLGSQAVITTIFILTALTLIVRRQQGRRNGTLDRRLLVTDLKDDSKAIIDTWH